ncbi:MAG TPA: hypothetical protein VEA81_00305 [Burkholderiaceae bacterium]|nr:hypothetical protein [Burkholderiaceae bacterium]
MERRTVIRAGLAGALLLTAGGAALLAGRDARRDRATVLAAIVPAVLDGALPVGATARSGATARCLESVGTAISRLAPHAQRDLDRLFALLASAPGRRLLAGVAADWPDATPAEVGAFLQSWRLHRLPALRAAYSALHDLVLGAWYADPSTWSGIGYDGPVLA